MWNLTLFQDNLAVVQALHGGKSLIAHSLCTQEVATMLECLLDDEAHRLYLGTYLLTKIHHTLGGITIGEEVVDEDDMVLWSQITVAHTYRVITILGKGVNDRCDHALHGLRLLFLDEDHRQVGQVTHHDGRSDARSLDGDNLVVLDDSQSYPPSKYHQESNGLPS